MNARHPVEIERRHAASRSRRQVAALLCALGLFGLWNSLVYRVGAASARAPRADAPSAGPAPRRGGPANDPRAVVGGGRETAAARAASRAVVGRRDEGARAQSSCATEPAGLSAWYPGDGNANDIHGGANGLMQGDATFAPGEVGQALSFDGQGDAVQLGNPAGLRLQTLTVEAWVKRGSAAQVSLDNPGGGCVLCYGPDGYAFYVKGDGRLGFGKNGVSEVASVDLPRITDTNFHHVAVIRAGQSATLYLDGAADRAQGFTDQFSFTAGAAIGAEGGSGLSSFLGLIDELSIYKRALSNSEIQAIYNSGGAGKCKATTVQFGTVPFGASEAGGPASLAVTRAGDATGTTAVHYATADGTAKAGTDYAATSGTLNFNPGETSKTITIPLVNNPAPQGDRSFQVTLDDAVGAALGAPAAATFNVLDNSPGRILAGGGCASADSLVGFNADGSNGINLTANASGLNSRFPSASRKTGMIAFASNRADADVSALARHSLVFAMDADGAGLRQVTSDAPGIDETFDLNPEISPDGTKIAFVSARAMTETSPGQFHQFKDIYVVNTDGTNLRRVTTPQVNPGGGIAGSDIRGVSWSPDGARLAFRGTRLATPPGGAQGFHDVLGLINADGTGETAPVLIDNGCGGGDSIDWSPDGSRIAVGLGGARSQGCGARAQIALYNLLTGEFAGIAPTLDRAPVAANAGSVRFSPDGGRLVYVEGGDLDASLTSVDLDGANETRLTGGNSRFGCGDRAIAWAAGARLPAPARFDLQPDPVMVFNGLSRHVTPTLYDAQGNVIFHGAAGWGFVCDGGDPRAAGHPCAGNARPTVTPAGVVTGDPDIAAAGTLNLCAANAGMSACAAVYNNVFGVTTTTPTIFKSGRGGPGVFTMTRGDATDAAAFATIALSGTATRDVDYTLDFTGNAVTIPAGRSSINVSVRPLSNSPGAGDKTVTLSFSGAAATNAATVTIKDDGSSTALSLARVTPDRGGAQGVVTPTVFGRNIGQGATVKLARAGQADVVGRAVNVAANGSSLSATFDLAGRSLGAWDVVVVNADGQTAALPGAFTVEQTRAAEGWVDVLGRSTIGPHRASTFRVAYGNLGDVNVYDVLLLVHLPKGASVAATDGVAAPPGVRPAPGLDGAGVQTDAETLVPVWLYVLPAGASRTITLVINMRDTLPPPATFEIRAELLTPPPSEAEFARTGDYATLPAWYGPSHRKNPFFLALLTWELAEAAGRVAPPQASETFKGSALSNFAPRAGGAVGPLADFDPNRFDPNDPNFNTGAKMNDAVNHGTFQGALDQGPIPGPYAYAGGIVLTIVGGAAIVAGSPLAVPLLVAGGAFTIWGIISTGNSSQAAVAKYQVGIGAAHDPNEMVGSPGAGSQRYVSGREPLRYAIHFENRPDASAPAQAVVVTDQLDPSKMDLSTFSLGGISFGDATVVTPPAGQKSFSTEVDLHPAKNLIVRVSAALNLSDGVVTWAFASADPATGQPPADVLVGFLPPNRNGTQGEGSVFYTVAPRAGLATGAQVRNAARVVFDANAPVDTNEWLNTIDGTPPASRVLPLAAQQTSSDFSVSWAGSDEGAGVRGYNVYVSEDGGPFNAWLLNTADTSAVFAGRARRAYAFYCVATDNANNVEPPKSAAEASTSTPQTAVQFAAASQSVGEGGGRATLTVTRTGPADGTSTVSYSTLDNPAAVRCDDTRTLPGVAFARCDYATTVGTLTFAPGETQKTFTVPVIDDSFAEPDETFAVRLSAPQAAGLDANASAAVTIRDDDSPGKPNPIDGTNFFVRQQYLDFLSREPETGGEAAWIATLDNCKAGDTSCDRVSVSGNFFRSQEFQLKGLFVFKFYKAAFGRMPTYAEIVSDMASVTGSSTAELVAKKGAFVAAFAQRPEFRNLYDAMPDRQFVDALMGRYNLQQITTVNPASPDDTSAARVALTRADLVSRLNAGTLTRGQAVRAVADSDEVGRAEFNPAFVAMQYFGYLRRDPDQGGYADWLRTINANPSDTRSMVNGFVNSVEYRLRFGRP